MISRSVGKEEVEHVQNVVLLFVGLPRLSVEK